MQLPADTLPGAHLHTSPPFLCLSFQLLPLDGEGQQQEGWWLKRRTQKSRHTPVTHTLEQGDSETFPCWKNTHASLTPIHRSAADSARPGLRAGARASGNVTNSEREFTGSVEGKRLGLGFLCFFPKVCWRKSAMSCMSQPWVCLLLE